jgi:hypothetical protein
MTKPSAGLDYKARRVGKGGSKPGRDNRPAPKSLKMAVWRYGVSVIGHGDEGVMYRNLGSNARFSKRLFEGDLLGALEILLPEEFEQYLGGREDRAGNILANRFHKMYYGQDKVFKGRGEASKEHPRNWSVEDRAAAEQRLRDVRWPW